MQIFFNWILEHPDGVSLVGSLLVFPFIGFCMRKFTHTLNTKENAIWDATRGITIIPLLYVLLNLLHITLFPDSAHIYDIKDHAPLVGLAVGIALLHNISDFWKSNTKTSPQPL